MLQAEQYNLTKKSGYDKIDWSADQTLKADCRLYYRVRQLGDVY